MSYVRMFRVDSDDSNSNVSTGDNADLQSLNLNCDLDMDSESESSDSEQSHDDRGDFNNPGCHDQPPVTDWQGVIEDVIHTNWPNTNWRILSRLLNIIGCTDRDSDVVLETIRSIDWTLSIPRNVAQLREVEIHAMGINK